MSDEYARAASEADAVIDALSPGDCQCCGLNAKRVLRDLKELAENLWRCNEALKRVQEHGTALDKNWSTLHEASMSAIREALGMPDASVPEMVERIGKLRGTP